MTRNSVHNILNPLLFSPLPSSTSKPRQFWLSHAHTSDWPTRHVKWKMDLLFQTRDGLLSLNCQDGGVTFQEIKFVNIGSQGRGSFLFSEHHSITAFKRSFFSFYPEWSQKFQVLISDRAGCYWKSWREEGGGGEKKKEEDKGEGRRRKKRSEKENEGRKEEREKTSFFFLT